MRIRFDDNTNQNVDRMTTSYRDTKPVQHARGNVYALDISGTVKDNTAYGVHGRTAEEVMQSADNLDVGLLRDYMTVMSNFMSTEDFAQLQKEGYTPSDTDVKMAVTIVDKIKSELLKAGIQISGYTDDLDRAVLQELTGSETMANALVQQFHKNDIPVTKENVENAAGTIDKAKQIDALSEGEIKYLVSNGMEPTIDHLYRAHFSGSKDAGRQGRGYYADEMPGYYAKKAEDFNWEQLQGRMEEVIEEAGLTLTEDTLADAKWLVEKGIPFTDENMTLLSQIKQTVLPASEEQIAEAIAGAMADGREPEEANLYDGRSYYQKAVDIWKDYRNRSMDDVKARRQLEEIRLRMTVEANVKLLRSGFSIETAPMEDLIEALQNIEEQTAKEVFDMPDAEEALKKQNLFTDTMSVTAQIPYIPAAAIGIVFTEEEFSLKQIYTAGKSLQAEYEQAGTAYETMMTTPRRDMGDSIRKAFRNVDAILEEMDYELTEANKRAVRILGYNNIPIEEDNILKVQDADLTVRRVVEQMTPASVLNMIRDGVNPLETDMNTLYDYFRQQNQDLEKETESYSRFLLRLQKNQEITPEEREGYIGVYRLLRQIEKSDGAVIGSVIQAGAELTFKNLLSAARTDRKKGMDVNVGDSEGGLTAVEKKEASISDQISGAYEKAAYYDKVNEEFLHEMAGEVQEEELQEQIARIRAIQDTEENVVRLLHEYDLPVTVNYMVAADRFLQRRGFLFKKLYEEEPTQFEEKMQALQDAFTDEENAGKAYVHFTGQMTDRLEHMTFEEGQHTLDIKSIQSAYKQLHIASRMAAEENYEIPVKIGEEVTAVRLKIYHDGSQAGKVSVTMENQKFGRTSAEFRIYDRCVSGYAAGTATEFTKQFDAVMTAMSDVLGQRDFTCGPIHLVQTDTLDLQKMTIENHPAVTEGKGTPTGELYQVAKLFIQVLQTA